MTQRTQRPRSAADWRQAGMFVLALLGMASAASAADPPHWLGALESTDCTTPCHQTHQAAGGQLTSNASNVNLCQSCHDSNPLPISNSDKASPHAGGTSHAFDVAAIQDFDGDAIDDVLTPDETQMSLRVMEGNIVCSTCHDQHDADSSKGGTPRVGAPTKATDLGSFGSLTSGGTYSGAAGVWYLIEITVPGNETGALFGYSKDNGTSWFPTNCVPGGVTTGCLTAGTAVGLDNGVTVTFVDGGGGQDFKLGEQWELYAAWPFLRAELDSGDINAGVKFCRDCHRAWVMTHDADLIGGGGVESWDGNPKSHPVGVALNANGQGYDRGAPLDGDGGAPGTDPNPSNDLVLDGTLVQCTTCHGVHYTDSNTETPDQP